MTEPLTEMVEPPRRPVSDEDGHVIHDITPWGCAGVIAALALGFGIFLAWMVQP